MEDKQLFVKQVLEVVKLIPPGRVTNFGAIARALGSAKSSRMVGWILGNAKGQEQVPAHRVVNRNGLLTGRHHFTPPTRMQELLESEGVKVVDHQVVDFKKLFWDPLENL